MLLKNWTKSARSSKNAVLAVLALMGIIAIYNWIVVPHANYLMAAQRHKFVIDALARKNEIISKDVIIRKKKLEKLQDEFEQVHTSLFDPTRAKEFFSDIEIMAEGTNCIIHSLNVSQPVSALKADQSKAGSYITANHATLSVVGNYGNIVALMSKLQDRLEQVRIDLLSIKSIGSDSNQLECDTTITVYVIQASSDSKADRQVQEFYPTTLRDPMRFGSVTTHTDTSGLIVKGIVYSKDNPSAVIGDQIVHEGDKVLDVTIIKINEDSVEFETNGEKWTQKVQR